jgi:hypothetical protein
LLESHVHDLYVSAKQLERDEIKFPYGIMTDGLDKIVIIVLTSSRRLPAASVLCCSLFRSDPDKDLFILVFALFACQACSRTPNFFLHPSHRLMRMTTYGQPRMQQTARQQCSNANEKIANEVITWFIHELFDTVGWYCQIPNIWNITSNTGHCTIRTCPKPHFSRPQSFRQSELRHCYCWLEIGAPIGCSRIAAELAPLKEALKRASRSCITSYTLKVSLILWFCDSTCCRSFGNSR